MDQDLTSNQHQPCLPALLEMQKSSEKCPSNQLEKPANNNPTPTLLSELLDSLAMEASDTQAGVSQPLLRTPK